MVWYAGSVARRLSWWVPWGELDSGSCCGWLRVVLLAPNQIIVRLNRSTNKKQRVILGNRVNPAKPLSGHTVIRQTHQSFRLSHTKQRTSVDVRCKCTYRSYRAVRGRYIDTTILDDISISSTIYRRYRVPDT